VYARAFTHEHQLELIVQIAAKMVEDQYRLLVSLLFLKLLRKRLIRLASLRS
jgi:hypothetical protein